MKVQVIGVTNNAWYGDQIGETFEVEWGGYEIYKVLNSATKYIRFEDCITIDVIRDNKLNELGI